MPNLAVDHSADLHLVYGNGDSILYETSINGGRSFSAPLLVATQTQLYAFATRGPQIACTNNGVTIIAASQSGNIYSYLKNKAGQWKKTARVNDVGEIAKEGLMALGGDGATLFAVWLDLRGNSRNKIFGASSVDGGRTWSKNKLVYASPDSTVCECCKPSVAVKGNTIYVMFRNWLHGNRDLYLIKSVDRGKSFGVAQKQGQGNWPINGCPMDGGAIAVDTKNNAQTIWRRQDTIFANAPEQKETALGKGKNCSIETINNTNVYAWNEQGEIVCLLPNGKKYQLGKGVLAIIKAVGTNKVVCVWENEKKIQRAIVSLL